ncbi:DUF2975 domain-containing protein, partial [Bacillus pseudomycoides]
IGMFLGIGGMIAVTFVPLHTLHDILAAKETTFDVDVTLFSTKIDVNHIQITKIRTLIINACIIYEVILTTLLFITIQLKRILQFARNKQPFSKSCIKHIRYLAYGVIIYGFITELLVNIWSLLLVKILQLSEPVIYLKFEMMITGFLILLLTHIFKYGAYLQDEYDSTL